MSKRARLPQSPRHVLLYDEDWEYLETRFGPTGLKPVGVSNVIRALIHQRILLWREAEIAASDALRRASPVAANAATQQHESMTNANPADLHDPPGSSPGVHI